MVERSWHGRFTFYIWHAQCPCHDNKSFVSAQKASRREGTMQCPAPSTSPFFGLTLRRTYEWISRTTLHAAARRVRSECTAVLMYRM